MGLILGHNALAFVNRSEYRAIRHNLRDHRGFLTTVVTCIPDTTTCFQLPQHFAAGSPLRIGATLSIGESVFIPLLNRFRKTSQQQVIASIHNTATLEKALLNDDLDLALVEGTIHSPYLKERAFMADELVFLTAPDAPPRWSRVSPLPARKSCNMPSSCWVLR